MTGSQTTDNSAMRTFGTQKAGDETLAGRLIIVTGASSGIGYGTARRLAHIEGARVIAIARRRVFRIEALATQIREQTGEERIFPVTTDMANREQAESIVKGIQEKYGRVDGFIHAVNRALRLGALEVSDHEFDLTMQINVKSALYGVQAVAPLLKNQGAGAIVIYNPTPRKTADFVASEAVYTAAAHALSALTAGWTRQLEGTGVGVREVAPAPDEDVVEALASRSGNAHDALLVAAFRDAYSVTAPPPSLTAPLSYRQPQTLKSRGGLVLKEF